jgi:ABC-type Mn2+/Zn2+ transport system ATPase subunit
MCPNAKQSIGIFPSRLRGLVEMGRYLASGPWRRFSARDGEAVDEALHLCDSRISRDARFPHSPEASSSASPARAWAQKAEDIDLLDEPFTGLDRERRGGLCPSDVPPARCGKLIMASHHDLKSVEALFDHILSSMANS